LDSTGVKLYIFIHNEVRDFEKNSTQPEIRVNRIRDNESQLYLEKAVWKYLKKKSNLRLDLTITGCTRYDMYGEVASDSEEEVDGDCSSTALHLDDWLRFKVDPEVC
jgi:hypothetical protein